jgi:aspartyl-tRNA synthetase
VQRRRDLGGVLFLDLRDRSGIVQAVVHPEQEGVFETLSALRSEWVVEVVGQVARRAPENVNPRMATGSLELVVDQAEVLAESATPPFVLDAPERSSEELRLKHRALELRRPELQANFVLRHKISHETRRFLDELGFLEMETPILTRSTPEGARDYLVPSRVHAGRFYALPQSPQIFKQLLMVAGFERYFQIARCFRDEDLRLDRQPEFTQIDLEMSFVDEAEVQRVVEGMLGRIFALTGVELPDPIPR